MHFKLDTDLLRNFVQNYCHYQWYFDAINLLFVDIFSHLCSHFWIFLWTHINELIELAWKFHCVSHLLADSFADRIYYNNKRKTKHTKRGHSRTKRIEISWKMKRTLVRSIFSWKLLVCMLLSACIGVYYSLLNKKLMLFSHAKKLSVFYICNINDVQCAHWLLICFSFPLVRSFSVFFLLLPWRSRTLQILYINYILFSSVSFAIIASRLNWRSFWYEYFNGMVVSRSVRFEMSSLSLFRLRQTYNWKMRIGAT